MFTPWRALIATCGMAAAVSPSQPSYADDTMSFHVAVDDTTQYFTAPLRWDREDWAYVGVAAAALVVAHQFDARVRDHFLDASSTAQSAKDPNSLRDAAPLVAIIGATWAYAEFIDDKDGYRETWSLLEAGIFSTATSEVLKVAAGRERPNVTGSPNRWRQGGDSFPSVHTTAAFAIGTVFAESGNDEFRWLRRIVGYGIAGGTAYIRLHENQHWLSDTVAGAAVGIATARFVLNRRSEASETAARGSIQFQPTKDGWMMSYVVDLN